VEGVGESKERRGGKAIYMAGEGIVLRQNNGTSLLRSLENSFSASAKHKAKCGSSNGSGDYLRRLE
jgi:hypothetical protein